MPVKPPKRAMIFAAGLGKRMQPLTHHTPKPLIRVHGKALLERAIQALIHAGVTEILVNVHHLADQIAQFLQGIHFPRITISNERSELLDTGGAVVKVLPFFQQAPFYALNVDSFWLEQGHSQLIRLAEFFDPSRMDMVLLTVPHHKAIGVTHTDFIQDNSHRLIKWIGGVSEHSVNYAGALIAHPQLFTGISATKRSLTTYFDRAIATKRLFGITLSQRWYHCGDIAMIPLVEQLLRRDEGNEQR